ncbi:uncharacterized protein [Montipora foliosa]|uniref:uncharacterized protein n=1 Tax=Montipora foliosa TaxID=591990 RepID=UPI0035F13933
MYWRLAATVVITLLSTETSWGLCSSPLVTYALLGGNATLCWKINVDLRSLKRFTIMALLKPIGLDLEKVASADSDGQYFRTFASMHRGIFVGKSKVYADIQARELFFEVTNYTTDMENMFCVMYEMRIINNVPKCIEDPLLLRTYVPSNVTVTSVTSTNATELRRPTKGRTNARIGETYFTPFVIVTCFLGVVFLAFIVTVIWCRRWRKDKKRKHHHKNKATGKHRPVKKVEI